MPATRSSPRISRRLLAVICVVAILLIAVIVHLAGNKKPAHSAAPAPTSQSNAQQEDVDAPQDPASPTPDSFGVKQYGTKKEQLSTDRVLDFAEAYINENRAAIAPFVTKKFLTQRPSLKNGGGKGLTIDRPKSQVDIKDLGHGVMHVTATVSIPELQALYKVEDTDWSNATGKWLVLPSKIQR